MPNTTQTTGSEVRIDLFVTNVRTLSRAFESQHLQTEATVPDNATLLRCSCTDRLADKGIGGLSQSDPLLRAQLQPLRLNYDAFVQIVATFCTYSRAEILQCTYSLCQQLPSKRGSSAQPASCKFFAGVLSIPTPSYFQCIRRGWQWAAGQGGDTRLVSHGLQQGSTLSRCQWVGFRSCRANWIHHCMCWIYNSSLSMCCRRYFACSPPCRAPGNFTDALKRFKLYVKCTVVASAHSFRSFR